jgi:D-serine deaminase-like pyridoxal phosphate-dependent protein
VNLVLDPRYAIADTSQILSPGLVVFRDLVESNLAEMIRIAGSPFRLRPHCKTHKLREIIELQVASGITKHKCATIAEAELLADAGVKDVFLAYNPVGPNIRRVGELLAKYPELELKVTGDDPRPIAALGELLAASGQSVEVLLDIDCGLHRTGLPVGPAACRLYEQIAKSPGVVPGGFHLYDGHNHQLDVAERRAAVMSAWEPARRLYDELRSAGLPVPRIVAGGTGSFPIFAEIFHPAIELSPGTTIFHDFGYGDMFPDMHFTPAALILTRVISRPTPDRLTLDVGYKAIASEMPLANRLRFSDLPDAKPVLQNEEHLVLETPAARRYSPGDELLAIPKHICPTCNLQQEVYVVSSGRHVATWQVAARDRKLTV